MGPEQNRVVFRWFRSHLGKRVIVEIEDLPTQSWRIYLAGTEIVVLVLPSRSKHLDQLSVFYKGIRRYLDPNARGGPKTIVGGEWNPKAQAWRPLRRADLSPPGVAPDVPDHLPDDL